MQLFTEDAVFEMPPFDGWYQGPANIITLSKNHCPAEGPGDMRFTAITANGQPAAALYMINHETGVHEEFQLHVLEVRPGGIAHVVAFHARRVVREVRAARCAVAAPRNPRCADVFSHFPAKVDFRDSCAGNGL